MHRLEPIALTILWSRHVGHITYLHHYCHYNQRYHHKHYHCLVSVRPHALPSIGRRYDMLRFRFRDALKHLRIMVALPISHVPCSDQLVVQFLQM